MKQCSSCKEFLDESLFSFHKNSLQSFCKECQRKYSLYYRSKFKDKLRKNLKEWRKENSSKRILSLREKLENLFRKRLQVFIKKDSEKINAIFGYSSKTIRQFFIENFGVLPNKEFTIKFKTPLKNFNLEDQETWKEAASLDNLEIFKKTVDK